MSIFHYKAIFLSQEGQEVFYKYCPDTIEQKESWGEFKFYLETWQPIITLRAKPKGEIVVYIDERCAEALTHKIKKHFETHKELPKEVFWIA
jgi:hypothetical protein